MPLSLIIKKECPICGKVAVEKSSISFSSSKIVTLQCGHIISEEKLKGTDYSSIISSDGRSLMPYQIEGVKFLEESGGRAILADEQGLGKTVQALALLKLHPELLPAIIVTKTTIKNQWFHEVIRWCGFAKNINGKEERDSRYLAQVINSTKEIAMPGMGIYITTYDVLKNENLFSFVEPKTLFLDECQAVKNHLAERSKAVQRVSKLCSHVIPLSGTPIKNNAGEYFTVLNLVDPVRFPEYSKYLHKYCDTFESMYGYKVGGLKNPELFHDSTKNIILRRTKDEVLKDLPPLERRFFHVELDRKLNKAYAQALKELDDIMYADDENDPQKQANMLAVMAKMRKITGISKVEAAIDFITDFLLSNDRKIVLFLHHVDVASLAQANLDKWLKDGDYSPCLSLHSGLSGDSRAAMVQEFKDNPSCRVMIASTLASGEGLNLQFCSDAIMLERQWNPANEEQAEARFHRFGQVNNVNVTYMIASETIDEYFTELVEQKRAIVASTLDNREIMWEQQSLMKELANTLVTRGREKWRL